MTTPTPQETPKSTTTPQQNQNQNQNQILNNSKIKALISQGLQTGMNTDKLKEQIVMMAQANYSVDKILTFTAYEINSAKKNLENLKTQAKILPGTPLSSSKSLTPQEQQATQGPYFSVRPPIPTYAINEMNLVILLRLYEESTSPTAGENENRDFFYSSKPLHEFVDQTAEYLFFSNPNSDDQTEMDIVKTRMEFLKELSAKKEEGEKITLDKLKELQADKNWMTKLSEDQKKAYEETLGRIKKAVRAAIRDLRWFGYVKADVYSLYDKLGDVSTDKDTISLERKGWAYLHLYLHVWPQSDQKNAFYFYVNMGLDRNFNW